MLKWRLNPFYETGPDCRRSYFWSLPLSRGVTPANMRFAVILEAISSRQCAHVMWYQVRVCQGILADVWEIKDSADGHQVTMSALCLSSAASHLQIWAALASAWPGLGTAADPSGEEPSLEYSTIIVRHIINYDYKITTKLTGLTLTKHEKSDTNRGMTIYCHFLKSNIFPYKWFKKSFKHFLKFHYKFLPPECRL